MKLILNPYQEPEFNLALEEYLLTSTDFELIMLWRNSKSVIIGNNQNAVEEIDVDYVRDREIQVIRRLSGGGAVFHDLGNINYTIIRSYKDNNFGGYEAFAYPVCEYLHSLGIKAEFSGRNDLVIDGQKFSGNAQTVKNGRIMHHGCILFDADFSDLANALKPKNEKIESKGVKSVRSRVTNISSHLTSSMTAGQFYDGLGEHFFTSSENVVKYTLSAEDVAAAHLLADQKYSSWDWNFGKSPAYNRESSKRYRFGTVEAKINVTAGVIDDICLFGDFFGILSKSELEGLLRNVPHERDAIKRVLEDIDIGAYIHGMAAEDFLGLLC